MKKVHVLLAAMGISVMAMSFTPAKSNTDVISAEKIKVNAEENAIQVNASEAAATPVVLVTVALAETSYAATVVATAAAVAWLFGSDNAAEKTPEIYRSLLNDIDMHSLDAKK